MRAGDGTISGASVVLKDGEAGEGGRKAGSGGGEAGSGAVGQLCGPCGRSQHAGQCLLLGRLFLWHREAACFYVHLMKLNRRTKHSSWPLVP